MLPGLVASGFGSVLNTKLAGQGYPPVTLWAPVVALAINVALNVKLIPAFGLVGAAAATSVAYVLWALIVAVAYRHQTGVAWAHFLRRR
jgi:O-antigen/teichoic acid export membrane protein